MLPDTFGTTQFLRDAPDWAADWTGQRIDSKNPYVAGDEYIEWLKAADASRGQTIIASDALDVDQILGLHAYFGWDTRKWRDGLAISAAPPTFSTAKMDTGPPHSVQFRLGNIADQ